MTNERKTELTSICNRAIKDGAELPIPVDFYSVGSAGLVLTLAKGRTIQAGNGKEKRVEQIIAEFQPQSAVKQLDGSMKTFGIYSTKNPKAVLALIDRISEKGDVCDSETYLHSITPAEKLLDMERERTVSVQNELLRALEENKRLNARLAASAVKPPAASKQTAEQSA